MNTKDKMAIADLSRESVLTVCYGYYMEMARALGGKNGFGMNLYGTNWHSYSPTPDRCFMGYGMEGLTHVEEYEDFIDDMTVIAFFDVGDYARQRRLRKQGKHVFGAAGSEIIELDRVVFKQVLEQAKLASPPYEVIHGIDNLRAHLQKHDDLWIKGDSKWRGLKETWYHEEYETSYSVVDELAFRLGCFRNAVGMPSPPARWVCESPWPGIESGADYFYSGGRILPIGTYGFEEKNEGYICKAVPVEQMPKAVRKVQVGMDPFHAMWNTSGGASTEVRVLCEKLYGFDIGEGYFLDATQRIGSPPAEIIAGLYSNLPHIVRSCAFGEMITPAPVALYAAQVILKSGLAMCGNCPVSVDKGFEDSVRFRRQCVIDGVINIIPMNDDEIIGAAVGYGRTKEEAQDRALEAADHVHAKELYYNAAVFDNELCETLEMAKELGMGVF
jgi:hypothetical protein